MPAPRLPDTRADLAVVARAAPVAAFARVRSPGRSRFTRSSRKQTGRARRAFRENGPGHLLMDSLGSAAYMFTLTPANLNPTLLDDPSGLYDSTVSALLAAVACAFNGPVYAVAEVGKGSAPGCRGRLHVHVVAHRDDGPAHVRRDTARCTPVYDVLGLYRYLAKPPEPYSLAAELDAAAARVMRPSGRLPNTRRHLLSAERLEWAAAQCPKNQTHPETTPATPAPEPQPSAPKTVLSDHRAPDTSARTSKPSQKTHVGEERTDSAVGKTTTRSFNPCVWTPRPRERGPPSTSPSTATLRPSQNGDHRAHRRPQHLP